ncbi:glycerophosphodiester phosphodiesterase family protein [Bacillus sp. JCM 19041]|uniref:glycerophosphodiester phosphodiesterase n=1 Tax=Bacillus sp. JCM 19041 TaxID=1460637 RepID=UPI0006D2BAD9
MKIKAIAHRGYPIKYPENTLSAYQASIDLGFSHIEIDVQLSKDGIPVIMHDKTVDRTTNGSGLIIDYTLDELKSLKMKDGEKMPTLEETLTLAQGQCKVAIELKQSNDMYDGLEKKVYELILEKNMINEVYVNSFNHKAIRRMRTLAPELELGVIKAKATPDLFPFMKEIEASSLAMELPHYTDTFADECEEEGIQLIVWPVDTIEACTMMAQRPNVWCTVNELERFKEYYQSKEG